MKKMSTNQIRQMWLEFFKSKGHHVEPSASLVPHDDPTLLWTNAGVTPLKKYFDGSVVPECHRITNAQKCIRTNDIENVGKTARHHTFFEMLGNFSIGDYFKKEVISWAVELLFDEKWFGFPKEKIYITYYTKDIETRDTWIKNGVEPSHLIPLDGNFWEIGEGPCGPDTEMFYDRGEKYDKRGIELIENDIENDRYIEIWNIVFSQFNSKIGVARENYKELPSKNIDTGCGLERVACVMQGVDTNYDTDQFVPLIKKVEEISGIKYQGQMAFKVIADHIRTVTFAISDGATLSNEGRGYVLRRVLRRATKYAKSELGINHPFMYELVDVVVKTMEEPYPYLKEKQNIVKTIVKNEEEKFLETLSAGEKRFNQIAQNAKDKMISGEDAFVLYDTYGFPLELTMEQASALGLSVDEDGFKKAMERQKNLARSARGDLQSFGSQNTAWLNFKEESKFIGYDTLESESKVIAVFDKGIVLDKTPFYAFSGGQVCDGGTIDGIEVIDVKKMPNGQHLHILEENKFHIGDVVKASVDKNRREKTMKNHSAAHLLQKALQVVLGDHVHQQGQQVSMDTVRFDFNNYNSLSNEEILKIEDLVNQYINEAYEVKTLVLPIAEAKKLGAMALFGEKYGEMVRVVDMGVSKEFCGGTHVKNTKDISKFAICNFTSIGSGLFRIEGVTSNDASMLEVSYNASLVNDLKALENKAQTIIEAAKPDKLVFNYKENENMPTGYRFVLIMREEIAKALKACKDLEKERNQIKSKNALSDLASYEKMIEGNTLFTSIDGLDTGLAKDLACALQNKYNLDAVMLALTDGEKLSLICATSGKYNAANLVREACKITGGGGGGKPTLAQAGAKDASKVSLAFSHIKEIL